MGHNLKGGVSGLESQSGSFINPSAQERGYLPGQMSEIESNSSRILSVWGPDSLLGRDPSHQHPGTREIRGVDTSRSRIDGNTERMIEQVWGEGMT